MYYLQSRYYNAKAGRFINADSYATTGQGILGNNMFAYCGNNPVIRFDCSGDLWGLVLVFVAVALVCTSSENRAPYYEAEAHAKYNADTVAVYERGAPATSSAAVNAEIYYPSESTSNISIDKSLEITSHYEKEAVLDVIIDSPYYSEEVYGSKSFMMAQWTAHNVCHAIASSGKVGFWIMQQISGSDDPIKSSESLDLRSNNNMLRRQKWLYTVLSWFE